VGGARHPDDSHRAAAGQARRCQRRGADAASPYRPPAREVVGDARLRVDYDEPFVEWLFREISAVQTHETLVRRLLRRDDRLLEWYIAYFKPRGLSHVVEAKTARGQLDRVLDCLFADAWSGGAAALEGRLDDALYEPLVRRRCLLRHGERALYHSRDPEVLAAISLGRSALSRHDGEW
jgi:hypothetical protein